MRKVCQYFCYLLPLFMLKAVHAAPDNLKVGQTAPDFRISSLQRDYFSLTELRAEGQVLLYFWSTRCHVCDSLLTKINALQVRYQNRQMTVVGVNIGYESHAEVRKYLNNNNFGFLVLNDDTQKNELREKYRIQATPLFVLVSRRGKIEYLGHAVPDLEQFIPSLNLGAVNP